MKFGTIRALDGKRFLNVACKQEVVDQIEIRGIYDFASIFLALFIIIILQ